MDDPTTTALHAAVLDWYDAHARELPWRGAAATPWSVMVSEFMLQQTPVVRVLPVHAAWLERWPSPTDLAADTTGEAVRMWGRLGYPRRALRLHAAAVTITERHDGEVPTSYDDLLALPGVGDYTASAIASFAFGQRHVVLDTNVRRVLTRVVTGAELPAPAVTRAERDVATALLPDDPATAATWAVATMELGALVCSARQPACDACPVAEACAWRRAGFPAYAGPPRRGQAWAGTDRQCRGRIMALAREADSVSADQVAAAWPATEQRERCLAALVVDGLLTQITPGRWALPG
ncbi:A/G-specific adenine glycosylase [Alloalcanivorax gelatiniphagus]